MIPFRAVHLSLISAAAIKTVIQCDLGGISNFPFQIWILFRKLFQVQVEQFPLQQITYSQFQPLPLKQPMIQGDLAGLLNFPLQIWILLEKQVHVQVKPSHLENVAQPLLVPPSMF